jgi:hypothetical protein
MIYQFIDPIKILLSNPVLNEDRRACWILSCSKKNYTILWSLISTTERMGLHKDKWSFSVHLPWVGFDSFPTISVSPNSEWHFDDCFLFVPTKVQLEASRKPSETSVGHPIGTGWQEIWPNWQQSTKVVSRSVNTVSESTQFSRDPTIRKIELVFVCWSVCDVVFLTDARNSIRFSFHSFTMLI